MSYKIKFLNDEEFDALPGKNMEDKLGVAYLNSQEAYVRQTDVPVLDVFNMAHELKHLEGDKLGEHYDADNQCYYKKKSNFFSKIGNVVKKAAPIAIPLIAAAIPGVGSAIGGALKTVGAGIGGLFGGGQSQAITPFAGITDDAINQMSGNLAGNLPGPLSSYPGGPNLTIDPNSSTKGPAVGSATYTINPLQGAIGQQGGYWSNIQPNGNPLQTGINTGDTIPGSSNFLSRLFSSVKGIPNAIDNLSGGENGMFANPSAALAGGGILGIGELMNKPINMPDFMQQPHVKALTEWSNTANHPMDPNVRDAIQRTLDIQNEQQTRNLRDVYKNLRPGTDYTTDSNYQRDYERLNRNMALQGADAMAGAQFRSNEQNIGNLGNLAQLGVGQNLGQAAINAQRQASRNRLFGNVGSMLGYKGIFGNRGPGFGAANPFSGMLGQGGP